MPKIVRKMTDEQLTTSITALEESAERSDDQDVREALERTAHELQKELELRKPRGRNENGAKKAELRRRTNTHSIRNIVCRAIRALRPGKEPDLTWLGEKTGVPLNSLIRFYRDGKGINLQTLQALCDFLGLELRNVNRVG